MFYHYVISNLPPPVTDTQPNNSHLSTHSDEIPNILLPAYMVAYYLLLYAPSKDYEYMMEFLVINRHLYQDITGMHMNINLYNPTLIFWVHNCY